MYTILEFTRNPSGSIVVEDHPEWGSASRETAELNASYLTQHMIGRFKAVLSLRGVNQHTQATDLSIETVRHLASEASELPFYDQAPEWAREGVDSVADRKKFTAGYTRHILSCIRAVKMVNRRKLREALRSWDRGEHLLSPFKSREEIEEALDHAK